MAVIHEAAEALQAGRYLDAGGAGVDLRTEGCALDGSDESAKVTAAIARAKSYGVKRITLQGGRLGLPAGYAFDAEIEVQVLPGGLLYPLGADVQINGPFQPGPYQVFDTSAGGTVAFGDGAVGDVAVEWWYDGANAKAALSAALNAGKRAVLSTSMSIDGTLVIGYREHLHLRARVTLSRSGASTAEVVRLGNSWATLTGEMYSVVSSGVAGGTVVRIGSAAPTDTLGIEFASIRDLVIAGDNASGSFGLVVGETSPTSSVYESAIKNVQIRRVGTGLFLNGGNANANDFEQVMYRDVHDYCIDILEGDENVIRGGFAHNCSNAAKIVRLRGSAATNIILGLSAEPGGSSTGGYELGASTARNMLFTNMNCPGTSSNAGSKNVIFDTYVGAQFTGQTVSADQFTGVNISNRHHSGLREAKTGIASGATAVCDIVSDGLDMFVEVDILVKFDGGGQRASYHYSRLFVEGSEAVGGGTAIQEFHNQSVGSFLVATTDFAVTRPSTGTIRITYTNSGSGGTTVTFSVRGVSLSTVTVS